MRIAVTGSSGMIGTALISRAIRDGHETVRVVRSKSAGPGEIAWNPSEGSMAASDFEGVDAVVNLAGPGIGDKRWTTERKNLLLSARVEATSTLAKALASCANPPSVLVSASAVGYYGDRREEVLTEDSQSGGGFLAGVCRQWEDATKPASEAGIRVVHTRTGIVLDEDGGALQRILLPARFGLGGPLGSGKQYWSWITLVDEVRAILHLATKSTASGAFNLTAPNPVPNSEFAKTLGHVLNRPSVLPAPPFALKVLLGSELATELLFFSQRALPSRLLTDGFVFEHTDLEAGLRAVLDRTSLDAPSTGA